jgi:putative SOS response-associated peptidase YedK
VIEALLDEGTEVRRGDRAQAATARGDAQLRWGILAPWRGHGGKRPPPIYLATLEDVAARPVLRGAARCTVRAGGVLVRAGRKREPYIVAPAAPAWFAAVETVHDDDGIASFALLVTAAPAELAMFTAVVPLVGHDAVTAASWRARRADADPSQGQLF